VGLRQTWGCGDHKNNRSVPRTGRPAGPPNLAISPSDVEGTGALRQKVRGYGGVAEVPFASPERGQHPSVPVLRCRPLCPPPCNASTGTAGQRTSVICSASARGATRSDCTPSVSSGHTRSARRCASKSAGDLHRSEVCRSEDAVFTAFDTWKAAMIEKGEHDARRAMREVCGRVDLRAACRTGLAP